MKTALTVLAIIQIILAIIAAILEFNKGRAKEGFVWIIVAIWALNSLITLHSNN